MSFLELVDNFFKKLNEIPITEKAYILSVSFFPLYVTEYSSGKQMFEKLEKINDFSKLLKLKCGHA